MEETNIQDAPKTETKPVIASVGASQRVTSNPVETKNENGEQVLDGKPNNQNGEDVSKANAEKKPEINDEVLKDYFKSKGIEYEGEEKLKEKLNYKPAVEPTEEEKKQQALAKDRRIEDIFINGGGTKAQLDSIKAIANTDVAELSMSALKKELKDEGFTNEQIDSYIKTNYDQFPEEDLEQYEDETDKEFAKRKKEYGAKKLANRSLHTKTQAQNILAQLDKELESEDLQAKEEVTISSKIDEDFKKLPRKLNFEIGEVNGKAIPPIEYEVSESDITEVQSLLKDSAKRQQFLFNNDGSLNLSNLTNVLTRNKYLESAVKAAYHEGGSRQVTEFQKTFPATTAYELGVGGSPTKQRGEKGKPASFGKTQRTSLQQHN